MNQLFYGRLLQCPLGISDIVNYYFGCVKVTDNETYLSNNSTLGKFMR
jgi:hypothetical protein